MPLTLAFKARDTLLVNGARISFYGSATISIENHISFVFGKQVMDEANATTSLRHIYFALQEAYAGEGYGDPMAKAAVLSLIQADPWFNDADLGVELRLAARLLRMGDFHPALRVLRDKIAADEAEISTDKIEAAA